MKSREKLLAGIEERLLALILRANRARIYEDLLRGADVRMDKALYPVLSATAAVGPARVSEISTVVGLNPTTTSRHLGSLQRMGLISRSSSDDDGRAAVVELTEPGRKAITGLRAARQQLFAKLLADFDSAELERFGDYLDRLFEAFEASAVEAEA
jgi:DNA-binding MarR family transcriptional regulator